MITVHFRTPHLGQTEIECDSILVWELMPARGIKQAAVNVLCLYLGSERTEVNISQVERITWSK